MRLTDVTLFMKPSHRGFLAFLASFLPGLVLLASPASAIQWLHDLDAAKSRARQQHKVLLVDFYADWCGPCRAMDAQVWNQPELAALSNKFVYVRLNFDREGTSAAYYEVKAIPTMLFLDAFDNKALHVLGYRSVPQMVALMRPLPEDTTCLDSLFSRTRDEADNFTLKVELADRYREAGMFLLSNKIYGEAAQSKELRKDALLVEKVETWTALNLAAVDSPDRAIEALENCLDKYPSSPQRPGFLLGLVRAGTQRRDSALVDESFRRLEKEFPGAPETQTARELVASQR